MSTEIKEVKKETTKSKIKSWIIFCAIVIMVIVAGYTVLNYVPYFSNREQFVVVTASMTPTIEIGDLVIVDKSYNLDDLVVGDVIAFRHDVNNDGTEEVVIHYIAEISIDEFNIRTFKTRRENITREIDWDSWTLTDDDIVGRFDFMIPKIGKLILFAESTIGKIIMITDVIVVYLVIDYFQKARKKDKEKNATLNNNEAKVDKDIKEEKIITKS